MLCLLYTFIPFTKTVQCSLYSGSSLLNPPAPKTLWYTLFSPYNNTNKSLPLSFPPSTLESYILLCVCRNVDCFGHGFLTPASGRSLAQNSRCYIYSALIYIYTKIRIYICSIYVPEGICIYLQIYIHTNNQLYIHKRIIDIYWEGEVLLPNLAQKSTESHNLGTAQRRESSDEWPNFYLLWYYTTLLLYYVVLYIHWYIQRDIYKLKKNIDIYW